ncbi:hypothetical protein [Segatella oulorum]|uniref:hypothetical protein n=1 Tax=Segatella oulorum TaxID=28136 RepID=UPI0023F1EB17|nr:hypothetical protein [Segatella oulorum]
MNDHAVHNPTLWHRHTPRCGVMINAMSCTIFALWRGDQWMMIRQPHRGCTLDSPGLPTIGGYPGEQGGWNATPLGVVLSFYLRSPCNKNPPRGCESEGIITDNGGYDGGQWRI